MNKILTIQKAIEFLKSKAVFVWDGAIFNGGDIDLPQGVDWNKPKIMIILEKE